VTTHQLKNQTPEEFRDPLYGITAPMILAMSPEQYKRLIYGPSGGFQPLPGRRERVQQIIAEWRSAKKS
jgi:hypothetical protein